MAGHRICWPGEGVTGGAVVGAGVGMGRIKLVVAVGVAVAFPAVPDGASFEDVET